jgi:hypothetical protein
MTRKPMTLDLTLVLVVALVWAALAAVYQFSPSLGMPGYVRVWGGGAVVFLGLAVVLLRRR